MDLFITGYVQDVLQKFHHLQYKWAQYFPYPWTMPNYRHRNQLIADEYKLTLLPPEQQLNHEKIIEIILYCARAVDENMLMALYLLSLTQGKIIVKTKICMTNFLSYCEIHQESLIWYCYISITIHIYLYAPYMSNTNIQSRISGLFILIRKHDNPSNRMLLHNGPVNVD